MPGDPSVRRVSLVLCHFCALCVWVCVCVCLFCCALRVRSSRQTTMSLSVSTSHTNSSCCFASPRFCSGDQRSGVSMWISVWEWKQAFRIVSPDPLPALFLCALRDSSTFEEVNRRSSSTASSSTSVGCVPVLCAWRPLRSARLFSALPLLCTLCVCVSFAVLSVYVRPGRPRCRSPSRPATPTVRTA